MLIPLFLLLRDDIADVRAVQCEQGERLAHIEATRTEHGGRAAGAARRLGKARCAAIWRRPTRMARIEGTVAGALGRPFPERMAQAPDMEAGGGASGSLTDARPPD